MPERADVVIVGGGIIGAACADALAEGGADVLLLEAVRAGRRGLGQEPGAGRLVASTVLGGNPPFDPVPFDPFRFD